MTSLVGVVRRLVLGVAVLAAALAALGTWVVGVEAEGVHLSGGLVALATVLAAAAAAGAGLVLAQALLLQRHARALSILDTQIDGLGSGSLGNQPVPVGLSELDERTERLSERAGEISRRQAQTEETVADASHQLRTPLTALLMRLEEIAATDDLAVAREEAGVAMSQVERLTGVVDTVLTRTKGGEGAVPEISLDSVLAGLQREYQPAFSSARRSMRVEGDRGLIVRAAPSDLAQVLQTLVENALEHGAGTVTIQAARRGHSVVVDVRDEGQGIPAAIAPHIFERAVTSRGSGLGLALARQLAQRNGGRLELVQARPAVFSVFLAGPRTR